jgi:hypothetical protein
VRLDWSATTSEAAQETQARVSEIRGDTLEVCLATLPSMELKAVQNFFERIKFVYPEHYESRHLIEHALDELYRVKRIFH